MSDKKYFNLLPEVYQTPVNRALYDSTYDSVFAEKQSEKIDGFIGRRDSGYYDTLKDFYKPEVNKDRTWYQLEPIALTQDPNTLDDRDEVFYENFVNYLKFLGGDTGNHDRIFSGDYYSFAPPIDVDKFINNQSYKWVENFLEIQIPNIDDAYISNNIIGKETFTTTIDGVDVSFSSGIKVKFVDSLFYNDVYTVEGVGKSILLVKDLYFVTEEFDSPEYVTIERGAKDGNDWSRRNKWYHIDLVNAIKEISNISIPFIFDVSGTIEIKQNENLPSSADYYEFPSWLTSGDVITVSGTKNNNATFTVVDRISDKKISVTSLTTQVVTEIAPNSRITYELRVHNSKRPIIEFVKDIELYNFGGVFRNVVDYAIEDKFSDIQNFDVSASPYALVNPNSSSDMGAELKEGDLLLFSDTTDIYVFDSTMTHEVSSLPCQFKLVTPLSDMDDIIVDCTRSTDMIFLASDGANGGLPTLTLADASEWPVDLASGQVITITNTISNNTTFIVDTRIDDMVISVTVAPVDEIANNIAVTFNDVSNWYSVNDESNSLSLKTDSQNVNWIASSDNIDGFRVGDIITVTFAEEQTYPVSMYVWVVTYNNIAGLTYINLLPYKSKSDTMNSGDVVIDYTLDKGAVYYVYDGVSWNSSNTQQKTSVFQPPLFNLYHSELIDGQARPLDDFNGTFSGSKIFSYKLNDNSRVLDKYLGIPLEYKDLGQVADIVFTHDLMTHRYDYVLNDVLTEIDGYYYFKQSDYSNDYAVTYNTTWLQSNTKSRQQVVDRHVVALPIETVQVNHEVHSHDSSTFIKNIKVDTVIGTSTLNVTYNNNTLTSSDYQIFQSGGTLSITIADSVSPVFTVTQTAGVIDSVVIVDGGLYNSVGDKIIIINTAGNGADVIVSSVGVNGDITGVTIVNGGSGYDNTDLDCDVKRIFVVSYTLNDLYTLSVMPEIIDGVSQITAFVEGDQLENSIEFSMVYYNSEPLKVVQVIYDVKIGDDIHFYSTSKDSLSVDAAGYYEIPQQLEANPTNNEVFEYTSNEMTRHFLSKIVNQVGVSGDELSYNNYRDTRKDLSLGGEIIQNASPLLKGMYSSSNSIINLVDSIRFSKNEYTRYKDKVVKLAEQLYRENFTNDVNNNIYIDALVKEIVSRLSNNIFYNDAFKHSYMFAQGDFYVEQTYSSQNSDIPASKIITISEIDDLDLDLTIPSNVIYVYFGKVVTETGGDTEFVVRDGTCVVNGIDYEIISYSPIKIQLLTHDDEDVVVRVYKEPIPDYMPSTPSKIGMHNVWVPELKLDDTYAESTYVIIGHDGSKTATYYAKNKINVGVGAIDGSAENYIDNTIVIESHGMKTGDAIIFEYKGVATSVRVNDAGGGYKVGDILTYTHSLGNDLIIKVDSISIDTINGQDVRGKITSVSIMDGGSGLLEGQELILNQGTTGNNATLIVTGCSTDGANACSMTNIKSGVPYYIVKADYRSFYVYESRVEAIYGNTPIDVNELSGTGTFTIHRMHVSDYALLEIEKRIYCNIADTFKTDYDILLNKQQITSSYFYDAVYSNQEFNQVIKSKFMKWKSDNNVNYSDNITSDVSDWKTWNYKSADPNLCGSWKAIYRYAYNTTTPHVTPWEMLGLYEKPEWWDNYYMSWKASIVTVMSGGTGYKVGDRLSYTGSDNIATLDVTVASIVALTGEILTISVLYNGEYIDVEHPDNYPLTFVNNDGLGTGASFHVLWSKPNTNYSSDNTRMWDDIELGLIRSGERSGINIEYIRAGLSNYLPVDEFANIKSPDVIGLVDIPVDKDDNWVFGQCGPAEEAWRNSSSYVYDLMEVLYTLKPADFGEYFWQPDEMVRAGINKHQIVDKNSYMRKGNSDLKVHGELDDEGNVIINHGYQRLVSDYLGFGGSDVKSTYGDVIRTLSVKLAHKYGGFTDVDTMDLFTESVDPNSRNVGLIIPKENINVKSYKGKYFSEAVYSGIVVRKDSRGYQVSGYDFVSNKFFFYGRKVNAVSTNIKVGGKNADFSYFKIGNFYIKEQIVKYNNSFYAALFDHTADKFTASSWRRLTDLPQVGGSTVTYTKANDGILYEIDYGHVYSTIQEVFDFIIGHGDYLTEQGWSFQDYNDTTNEPKEWLASAKDFIFWTQSNWGNDNTIFLNPISDKLTLTLTHGYPDSLLNENTNGSYSIVDQYGFEVSLGDVYVDRNGKVISVESLNPTLAINGLRVSIAEHEHIMILDNTTIFNDLIYETTLNSRQHKLRLSGYRTTGWYGKHEAPGYLIQDDKTLQNTENLVETLRDIYNSEVPLDNRQMEDAAKHLIGYESKTYLDELQVSGDIQYKFYQGMLKQKGSSQALDKLLRSDFINGNNDISVYEEWAFKLANFGAVENTVTMEFLLDGTEVKSDPQMVNLLYPVSDLNTSYIKRVLVVNAETIYKVPPTLTIEPALTDVNGNYVGSILEAKLDSKGYISSVNIVHSVSGYTEKPVITANIIEVGPSGNRILKPTSDIFECVMNRQISDDYKNDDVITIDIDDQDRWLVKPNSTRFDFIVPKTNKIEYKLPNAGYVHKSDVDFMVYNEKYIYDVFSLKGVPVDGQYIWMADASSYGYDWTVFTVVENKTYIGVDSDGNQVTVKFDVSDNQLNGYIIVNGVLYTYLEKDGVAYQFFDVDDVDVTIDVLNMDQISIFKTVRYNNLNSFDNNKNAPRGWVDNVLGKWVVYDTDVDGKIYIKRRQEQLVDTLLFAKSYLYDVNTENTIVDISPYDPFKGLISGVADRNLTFKSDIDPARYTHASSDWLVNDDMAFTESKVGQLWWDLSTCKYLYYEQADSKYRRDNWGAFFEGSSVDVYEWTKSATTPANYNGDGVARNTTDYVSRKEYNEIYNNYDDVYYFWVKDKQKMPSNKNSRTMSSSSVAANISNPSAYAYVWFSFIDDDNFIFSNLNSHLKNSKCVFQFNYNAIDDNKVRHAEWKLIREGDSENTPTNVLWNKMVDSLCEMDVNGNIVPDPRLSYRENLGNKSKPIQTWFVNVNEARRCATQSINEVLIKINVNDSNFNWEEAIGTSLYWKWVDWFEEGYETKDITPKKQVTALNVFDDLEGMKDGDFIKEYKKNDSTWYEVVSVETNTVKIVRREKSAIQLKDALFIDKNKNALKNEFRMILTALKNDVFISTFKYGINKLFFSMVNYVVSEQKHIDWAFKTTYISVAHSGQELSKPKSFRPNTINSFLAYLNEVKPYSTKLREYNLKLASPLEIAHMKAFDFDSLSYDTPPLADQENGDSSSTLIENPQYVPTEVPRIFKVTTANDTIQCGFQERNLFIPITYIVDDVVYDEETKYTVSGETMLTYDYIKVIHTVSANGHILPADFYTATINGDTGKLELTLTQGAPISDVALTIKSGVYVTHTALEEARLFNSRVNNDYDYSDLISYNLAVEAVELPLYGYDEVVVAYNIGLDVYGTPLTGFGVPQFGTNPFGVGGNRVIDDMTISPTFKLKVGGSKRFLELNRNIKSAIKRFSYDVMPAYSQYSEVINEVGAVEINALESFHMLYDKTYECGFKGETIDGELFPFIFTQAWDTEAWDVQGNGWDRELSLATTVNPYSLAGGYEDFEYNMDENHEYIISGVCDIQELVIIENRNGVISETYIDLDLDLDNIITSTDYNSDSSTNNYKTKLTLNTDLLGYTPNPPAYEVTVRFVYKPTFMFLIGAVDVTPDYRFYIPYDISGIKMMSVVDSLGVTITQFDNWVSSYVDGVTTITTTTQPTPSSSGITNTISYMIISYDHDSSNVFDNGELFDSFDASYLAQEYFDDGMLSELAQYNVSESVVINVNTNCNEKSITLMGDDVSISFTLPVDFIEGMASVEVYLDDVLLSEYVEYDLVIVMPDNTKPANYELHLLTPPAITSTILIKYKSNGYRDFFIADDPSHHDTTVVNNVFFGGSSYDLSVDGNGFDVGPYDAEVDGVTYSYSAIYPIPSIIPISDPNTVRVFELSDSPQGIASISKIYGILGYYTIESVDDYVTYMTTTYPSATTQSVRNMLISKYKSNMDSMYYGAIDYDVVINDFSIMRFAYSHVSPIESFDVEALADCTISVGVVDVINITDQGLGYTYVPEVIFTGGGGSGAKATAVLDANGSVVSIILLDGGTGYATPPTITLNAQVDHGHDGKSGQRILIEYAMPETGYTVHYEEMGNVTYTRNSTDYSSELYAEFKIDDPTIKVVKNIGSPFLPVATIYDVGIIWIGNERITYTQVVDNGDHYELFGVIRGTNGTSTPLGSSIYINGIYPIGQRVYDGSVSQQVPNGDDWRWVNSNGGLSLSTTEQAQFLMSHTGCKNG